MSLLLSIETATTNCSVSLSENGKTLALKEDYSNNFSHAEKLHVYIDSLLKENNIKPNQIDAVAVSKGPGSYTGLRIGVSAAKGLCFALNKPLISIPTLTSLSHQIRIEKGKIVSMLDARRLEVYSAVFDSSHIQIRDTQAEIVDTNSYNIYLDKGKVFFIGTGVQKTKELLNHTNAIFIEDKLPSANEMSELSYQKFKTGEFEDVAYFEPYYLKDFVAIKPKN
ncbi:tRNA (adenosine(37)-N6)-threonylcarbamoyltransferase complex dimerization subunit type 1 TsaB [Yeosuana sp. MJ-SS3]|uniref:tRNA (Adenosine(37)-N6)-threonylcarbamoyltransferase complex dimerization subunit type 1 TsaB n=1 Tax=Gilvirhabdus luticola TaxID=3079858 RepID=A0ABU3U963_9FLAO|nr:tRNA (adenosine(37)-N6)-threonylcarbamoyltransferase complex dimerization subunit type 1 TsaB [Yeosuana sp. MJ-SS3]MDU8886620.1 tRNA (adenosine(37)-N6)-threonylcarbamoyltransferase complex dimerization subunit type 1 TsaB [Yeosuana sp. MJ-SS3]